MPGFITRTKVSVWTVTFAEDLRRALDEAEQHINEHGGDDAYLSFVVMKQAASDTNVDYCTLVKVTMTDDSVAWEMELE